jgi:putative flippase GtrA
MLKGVAGSTWVRYLIAGSINTAAAQIIYLALLALGLRPMSAYALSFVFGTGLGYVLHGRYVFRVRLARPHMLRYPLANITRLGIGEGLLWTLIEVGVRPGWAGLAVNVVMVPVGYLLTRMAFQWRVNPAAGADVPESAPRSSATG